MIALGSGKILFTGHSSISLLFDAPYAQMPNVQLPKQPFLI